MGQMLFTLGGRRTAPTVPCGEVSRMIVNPAGGTVTHLVVTPKPANMTTAGGMSRQYRAPKPARTIVQEVVPAGATQVRHGEHVHAVDGEVGRLQGFLVGSDNLRISKQQVEDLPALR